MEHAPAKPGGKLLIRDEIGTFEREPNENVTESASPLRAKFFIVAILIFNDRFLCADPNMRCVRTDSRLRDCVFARPLLLLCSMHYEW